MRKRHLILLPLAIFIATACDPEPKNNSSTSSQPPATAEKTVNSKAPESSASTAPAGNKPSVDTTTPSTTASATPPSTTPGSAPAVAVLPPEIKTEGYDYSGLANPKPVDMELIMSTQPGQVITGSETVTLKEVKGGQAVYNVDRTGGLAVLGTEEWTLDKDGVYTTKSSVMDLDAKAMELPAVPKPGMTWKVHTKADKSNMKMDMVITFKIIGKQSVTTKAGKHEDALMVEQDGVGTLQNQKVRTVSQNWYVKGLGLVKAAMKTITPDGKTESLSIQETKTK